MIKIKYLTLNNFLSWYGNHKFDLDNLGLVYITGPNGSGKSSIFDGVVWALFGVTSKSVSVSDIPNREAKKDCYVKLTFYIKKIKYTVIRYRNHRTHKNNVSIYCNGKKMRLSHAQAATDHIQKLLGMNYRQFIQTIFFSQSDRRYFTAVGETERRAVLGDLYSFDIFKKSQEVAKTQSRSVMADLDAADFDYKTKKMAIQDGRARIEKLESKLSEVKTATPGKSKEELSDLLAKKNEEFEDNQEVLKAVTLKLTSRKEYLDTKKDLEEAIADTQKKLRDIKKEKKCPTCFQVLEKKNQSELEVKYQAELDGWFKELHDVENALKTFYYKKLLNSREEAYENEERLVKELKKLEKEYSTLLATENAVAHTLHGEIESEKKSISRLIKEYKVAKKKFVELRTQVEYLHFWEEGFGNSGIELYALSLILPNFNKHINKYLSFLPTNNGRLEMNYSIKNKHLVSTVQYHLFTQEKPVETSWDSLSGGEKRRIEICTSLALCSLGGFRTNFLMLDEPFDGIEASLYGDIVKMLRTLPVKSVFVTSHNSELRTHFPNTWRVFGEEGHSQIEKLNKIGIEIL